MPLRQIESSLEAKDYALRGRRGKEAIALGMHDSEWYKCPVPRATLKKLMQRRDGPGIRDTLIWLGSLGLAGAGVVALWGNWLAIPLLLVYGVLYASAGEARWHECSHGTPFRTPLLNGIVYQTASFFSMRNPTLARWSHARHHTDTYLIGLDPEIVVFRPPDILRLMAAFFGLREFPLSLYMMVQQAFGVVSEEEKLYVPESERPKVARVARAWVLIYLAVIGACLYWWTLLPAVLIGLPRLYGVWFIQLVALTQHAGLLDDVHDHRLDTRTFHMNLLGRFMYWNMNYHIEHHMYPMVPYYNLPLLHEAIKDDCPPAYRSLWEAYAEIVPTLYRQLRDPSYRIIRPLSDRAPDRPASPTDLLTVATSF